MTSPNPDSFVLLKKERVNDKKKGYKHEKYAQFIATRNINSKRKFENKSI